MDPFDLTVIALVAIFGGGYALVKNLPNIIGAIADKSDKRKNKRS